MVFPSVTYGNLDNKLSLWFLLKTYFWELSTDIVLKKRALFSENVCKLVYSVTQVTCIKCQTCEWDPGLHGEGGDCEWTEGFFGFFFDSPTHRALLSHSCRGRVQRPPLWCWPDPLPDWWTPGYLRSNNAHTQCTETSQESPQTHAATNALHLFDGRPVKHTYVNRFWEWKL